MKPSESQVIKMHIYAKIGSFQYETNIRSGINVYVRDKIAACMRFVYGKSHHREILFNAFNQMK